MTGCSALIIQFVGDISGGSRMRYVTSDNRKIVVLFLKKQRECSKPRRITNKNCHYNNNTSIMSLQPTNIASPTDSVSKVTFSPVDDGRGNAALIVTIKSCASDTNPKPKMDIPKITVSEPKKRSRSSKSFSEKYANKSTMTDTPEVAASEVSSRNICLDTVSAPTLDKKQQYQNFSVGNVPCLKHAAENISAKAADMPSEKISLCNTCSKSMLSYIFVVQDFLESLAGEICGDRSDSEKCVQCLRQENRERITERVERGYVFKSSSNIKAESSKNSRRITSVHQGSSSHKQTSSSNETRHDIRKYEETFEQAMQRSQLQQLGQKVPKQAAQHQQTSEKDTTEAPYFQSSSKYDAQSHQVHSNDGRNESSTRQKVDHNDHQQVPREPPAEEYKEHRANIVLKPMERQQPTFEGDVSNSQQGSSIPESPNLPFSESVDGIVSTLSNAERKVYDSARNGAGYESLSSEPHEIISDPESEAFVTICRNNAEALGCLIVGTSLLLTRTTRNLCVLVGDGVSTAFRGPLSSVFQTVQTTRTLDSLGNTKLALLEQPELGISFDKLNAWRLTQFSKCVFLNPDCLVLQNCDELFDCEEISAVPDIGWPDCFNSGVFVYRPSNHTFWNLLEYAGTQGSYDGGDQGLLNAYFNNWSQEISRKLSFLYNLMANVSYTYTPAFKQFGRDVKIVQFHGSSKPWHVKYYSRTGQISPASTVHPTYIQFVHIWINIFRIGAIRQLSQEIQSYALSQEIICALEVLRFFPLPTESEAEFYLTPPSVRLRLTEQKLQRTTAKQTDDPKRRKSAEFSHKTTVKEVPNEEKIETGHVPEDGDKVLDVEGEKAAETEATSALPGAEIGNYQGMKAWEQGRMDYQGVASSETIIKRLQYIMDQQR